MSMIVLLGYVGTEERGGERCRVNTYHRIICVVCDEGISFFILWIGKALDN